MSTKNNLSNHLATVRYQDGNTLVDHLSSYHDVFLPVRGTTPLLNIASTNLTTVVESLNKHHDASIKYSTVSSALKRNGYWYSKDGSIAIHVQNLDIRRVLGMD